MRKKYDPKKSLGGKMNLEKTVNSEVKYSWLYFYLLATALRKSYSTTFSISFLNHKMAREKHILIDYF